MTSGSNQPELPEGTPTGLAIKITGIVFWGLVVMGLALTTILLWGGEDKTAEDFEIVSDHIAFQLQENLLTDSVPVGHIETLLKENIGKNNVEAIEISYTGNVVTAGISTPSLYKTSEVIYLPHASALGMAKPVAIGISVYFTELQRIVDKQRRILLLTLGLLFVAFGFILLTVLDRVLTQPFLRMVNTANEISTGMSMLRFDERRDDEFGFLGQFINRSLDYLNQQRNEIADALNRIKQSETALFQEKERAEVTLHSIGDAVITTNAQGMIEYLNPVAERIVGLELSNVRGKLIDDVIHIIDEDTKKDIENPLHACLETRSVVNVEKDCAIMRDDGRTLAISSSAAPIRNRKGEVIGAIMVFQDVTPTRKLSRELTYQATHDALTGLFNRCEFETQLQIALQNARNENVTHTLCYLDLDQFKVVNDTCGHTAGDELLRQLAELLRSQVRDSDVLARLGGDEIGVLLTFCDINRAYDIADKIRLAIKQFRFVWHEHVFEVGVSIGMVLVSASSKDTTELLSAADVACYAAKDLGRNRVHVYTPDDREMEQRRGEMQWVSRITRALDNNQYCLYYQPILPIKNNQGMVPHYEVLMRLIDENGKLIPPMAFIPAAERYDLMSAIDRWVVQAAFSNISEHGSPPNAPICSINLSGQSLGDDVILEFISEQLQRPNIDPHSICFEITETAAIANLSRAMSFIRRIKDQGCRFALDDFGSGLSSFGYLKNLEVDYIKIDGAFIRNMVNDPIDYAMVEAISHIGHVMGIQIIAEFVENQETLDALARLGVDYIQGYHVAKPAPLSDFDASLPTLGARNVAV